MKKIIVAVLLITVLFTGTVRAQTVDMQAQYQTLLVQLINLLMQQVSALQAQLAELQASVQTLSVAPVQPTRTPEMMGTTVALAPEVTSTATSTPEVPKTITIRQSGENQVQIVNDTGVAVRIKNLSLKGVAVGNVKMGTWSYPVVVKNGDASYPVFDCNGLGSLGTYGSYGNPNTDPCQRKDSNIPRNELQPGETMTLQLQGTFAGLDYATGSIVEVETGKDVQFSGL
jgi:hypothetical protein